MDLSELSPDPFDAVLILENDYTVVPAVAHKLFCSHHDTGSLYRWNVCGIDCWLEANRHNRAISTMLKEMDSSSFGTFDLLGPLKNPKGTDIEETPIPSV